MKLISTYVCLYMIPAMTFAQNVEQCFMEDPLVTELRLYCECGLERSQQIMSSVQDSENFYYHNGKCWAYYEILAIIDAD